MATRDDIFAQFGLEAPKPGQTEKKEEYKETASTPVTQPMSTREAIFNQFGLGLPEEQGVLTSPDTEVVTAEADEQKWYWKLLDTLSTGAYAGAGAVKEMVETGKKAAKGDVSVSDFFLPSIMARGARKGIAEKTTYKEPFEKVWSPILEPTIGKKATDIVSTVAGLAQDIVLDPLMFIPVGKVGKLGGHAMLNRFPRANKWLEGGKEWAEGKQIYQSVGKALKPGFGMPAGFHKAFKEMKFLHGAEKEQIVRSIQKDFAKLSNTEIEDVAEVLDQGIDAVRKIKTVSGKVEQLAAELRTGLDNIFDELVDRGLAKRADKKQFYFPHQFEKYVTKSPANWTEFKPIKDPKKIASFLKQRTGKVGWMKNAAEVLARYRIDASKTMLMDDFLTETMSRFGKRIDDVDELQPFLTEAGEEVYKIGGKTYKKAPQNLGGDNLLLEVPVADEFAKFINGDKKSFFWQKYDRAHNVWKGLSTAGVLVPNPGYTSRNILGNFWNAYLGGVINPIVYAKAAKQQFTKTGTYQKMRELGMMDNTAIYQDTEKLFDQTLRNPKNFWYMMNRVFEWPKEANNFIENNAKLGVTIDQLQKGKSLDEAIEHANKYLFDYTDLTDWERKWGKRVIPFYTWMRKNVPLQATELMKQPGKFTVPAKVKHGVESLSEENLVADQERPDWMTDVFFIQAPFFETDEEGNQVPLFYNPYLPFQDFAELTIDPKQESITRISPFIKAPIEIIKGERFWLDKEITSDELSKDQQLIDYTQYLYETFGPRAAKSFDNLTNEEKGSFSELMKWLGFYMYPLTEERRKEMKGYEQYNEAQAEKRYQKRREKAGQTTAGSIIQSILGGNE